MKMAAMEVSRLNSDKDFKPADCGFALTQVYKISLNGKIRPEFELLTYLPRWKALPKTTKVFCFTFLSLNSQISFTIVMLFESFL